MSRRVDIWHRPNVLRSSDNIPTLPAPDEEGFESCIRVLDPVKVVPRISKFSPPRSLLSCRDSVSQLSEVSSPNVSEPYARHNMNAVSSAMVFGLAEHPTATGLRVISERSTHPKRPQ